MVEGFDDMYRYLTEKTYPKGWKSVKSATSDERYLWFNCLPHRRNVLTCAYLVCPLQQRKVHVVCPREVYSSQYQDLCPSHNEMMVTVF